MKLLLSVVALSSLGFFGLTPMTSDAQPSQPPQPVVTKSTEDPAPARAIGGEADERAIADLHALVLSRGEGYTSQSMAGVAKSATATFADDGDVVGGGVIECGTASGAVTAGSTAVGCGATVEAAIFNAKFNVETNLWANFPADCQECPNPGMCSSYVNTLDWGWSFGLPFKVGAQWCVKGTYTGAYLFVCEDCF